MPGPRHAGETRPGGPGRAHLPLCVAATLLLAACRPGPEHSIVPMPESVATASGTFVLDASVPIALADPEDERLRRLADVWAEPYRAGAQLPLPIADAGSLDGDAAIRLSVDAAAAGVGPEGYRLDVTAEGVSIIGADHAGVFYGLQTLSQLMPPGTEARGGDAAVPGGGAADAAPGGGVAVAPGRAAAPGRGATAGEPARGGLAIDAVSVVDEPRFAYRGMHLDVARHFYGPDFVKRYIDLLARYKLNRFHWHLTEDQGWRIEIDAYPRLTEVGAWRDETHVGHGNDPFQGDGEAHGGYYTKEEIRDVVAYARDRFVMVVPEIEMPGHASAALAAYPELACHDRPIEVARTWGVFDDIFCPHEETFDFLETVLGEVVELFPGDYVHIGGDEAPKEQWEESGYVQDLMFREGIAEVEQVQGWFLRRIERFLGARGKRLIGWDEILEGGLPENAVVMSWRGTVGGIEASRRGHEVVMTPYSHLYFDYYQSEDRENEPLAIGGFLPLDSVYAYEPIPGPLRPGDAARIIGAQANLWTEYVKTPEHVEYMLLPRMLALSEVVWSPREARDFEGFLERLDWHLARFDAQGVTYRPVDR